MTWVEALTAGRTWDEERDAPRIREGFVRLTQTATQWPVPRDLLTALPPGPPQKRLPPPTTIPPTPEARLERLRALLGDACTIPREESVRDKPNAPQNAPQDVLGDGGELPPLILPPGPDEE